MKVLTQTQKLRNYLIKSELPHETIVVIMKTFTDRPKEWGNPEVRRVK